jgi:hypothetical protein
MKRLLNNRCIADVHDIQSGNMQPMATILTKLSRSEALYERARGLARRRGQPASEVVRLALEEYLLVNEKQQTRLEENQKKRLERALNKNVDEFADGDVV